MGMISKIIQKERETNNKVAQTGRSTKTQKKEKQQSYSRTATVMFVTLFQRCPFMNEISSADG